MADPLLAVEDLSVSFKTDVGTFLAVDGISFSVERGEIMALVGESGCGKSVTCLTLLGLLPNNGSIDNGKMRFEGKDLSSMSASEIRDLRGDQISMIFQDPMTALNPLFTVGSQIAEVYQIHRGMNAAKARESALAMLKLVRIPDPERRIDEYPFQLSGGMRQRVLVAMALACEPALLLADEPTTALDVTVQAQILKLIRELQKRLGTGVILVTHDLGVVAELADRVSIMYKGKIIERGSVYQIFDQPFHPYTQGLLESIPSLKTSKKEPLTPIPGAVPSIYETIHACPFHTRCKYVAERCKIDVPAMREMRDGQFAACHFAGEVGIKKEVRP